MLNRNHRRLARSAAALSLAAAGGLASAARADDSCTIRVTPQGASSVWRAAAADAQRAIDDTAPAVRDCRRIEVEVSGNGATLTFVTRDGRTATRALPAPSALRPVVEGLLVTLPMYAPRPPAAASNAASTPSAPSSSAGGTASAASSTSLASSTPPVASASASAPPRRTPPPPAASSAPSAPSTAPRDGTTAAESPRVLLAATAGVRLGTPHSFFGPAFGLDGSFAMARWELGAFGFWEPANAEHNSKALSGSSLSTLGLGVHVGRREPLGALQLLYAATASVVRIAASADTLATETVTDTRFGALVGIAWPQGSKYRFRVQLQGDYNPARHGQSLLSGLPRWSFGLQVGLETELL